SCTNPSSRIGFEALGFDEELSKAKLLRQRMKFISCTNPSSRIGFEALGFDEELSKAKLLRQRMKFISCTNPSSRILTIFLNHFSQLI
ncbi:MAG: hypothetical protein U9Q06_00910, partial [Nanoarchaeota archaeon]|nr:hypothetical protein [Nanoarchaeota archaeon]